jgi:hypothetical protein
VIGDRDRRHPELGDPLAELGKPVRAVEKGVLTVEVEMNEVAWHRASIITPSAKPPRRDIVHANSGGRMISRSRFAALLLAAALWPFVLPAAGAPSAPVGPDSVWKPPADFRAEVDKACASAGKSFDRCFASEMRKAGASAAALAFTERAGNPGYVTAFLETGRVDVAYFESPYRANENALVYLVNGSPPMFDVDDPSRMDQTTLVSDPVYASLLRAYPALSIFPGDRRPGRELRALKRQSGGQRFELIYELHDGCHACKIVGYARIGFNFDVEGRFIGTELVQIRAERP